jgi:hypothetical protein
MRQAQLTVFALQVDFPKKKYVSKDRYAPSEAHVFRHRHPINEANLFVI